MGYFVTKPNIIFHGHVINLTFKMWHPKRGNLPQVKGKDKARFLQAAVCCSTYHKSTCRIEEVSGVAEFRGATIRQSRISEHEFMLTPLLF